MQKLFLDIETLPAAEEKREVLKTLHAKRNRGEENFEQYYLKTSFDGGFGRILCVGYAIDNRPAEILYSGEGEKETLRQFWEIARHSDMFIGHNILDFDLRFIYQRSIVNNIVPSKDLNFARYRNFPIFDTMKEWGKWGSDNAGLEYLALALGIPSPKDGIDGARIFEFYQNGKIDEILEYCKRDVETAREIFKRINFEK